VNIKHIKRAVMVSVMAFLAFMMVSIASFQRENEQYFYLAIAASVCVGFAQATGEATFLGYLKGFPSHLVGFVSRGTGFAGISANLILLSL
jgi:hypothetical protein